MESNDGTTPTVESLFPEELTTPRLRLERTSRATTTVEELRDFFSDFDGETEHMRFSPARTWKEARELLTEAERRWDDGENAMYLLRCGQDEPDAGELAGFTNLQCDWERRTVAFGTCLRRDFWGRGYLAERAEVLCRVAFDHLDMEVVEIVCTVDNERARAGIEKYVPELGGRYVGVVPNKKTVDGDPVDCHYYVLTADSWD